jgi:hypothetical protein
MIIQIAFGVIYLASSLWLLPLYGLYGFCQATILSNLFRLLAFYALGLIKIGARTVEEKISQEKTTEEVI